MFDNITKVIKRFAYGVFWAGMLVLGMLLYDNFFGHYAKYTSFNFFAFVGYGVVGVCAVFMVSTFIYAFAEWLDARIKATEYLGQIAENTKSLCDVVDDE